MARLAVLAQGAAAAGVSRRGRSFKRLLLGASSLLVTPAVPGFAATHAPASALPQGGSFVAGAGSISAAGSSLNVTQSTARGVIDWRSFSIGAGGLVTINNGAGATLGRVLGGDLSRIDGALTATGSFYLINPAGVVVGSAGRIVTGGAFVASTRDVSSSSFMAGGSLTATGRSTGDVINGGSILAHDGDVVLIGRSVDNSGDIAAPRGTATLAAADTVLMTTVGGPAGVYVAPDVAAGGDVVHTGRIEAAAAALKAAGGDVYTLAGNRAGLISATGVGSIDGQVWLLAPQGSVVAGGATVARSATGAGGMIVVDGARTTVAPGAVIEATGTSGGVIRIGVSGAGAQGLSDETTIGAGATITAGGPSGGGLIETSGRRVSIGGADIRAGVGGSWVVDPIDLTIDSAAASTLQSSLDAGTNVTEQTDATTASGSGVQAAGAGDIVVAAPITWTGSGSLTLQAYHDLHLNAAISGGGGFSGSAGGAVTVGAALSATSVQLSANAGDLTLGAGVSSAGAITLATSGAFTNTAGAAAFSGGGRWLVYSASPTSGSAGGLAPDFYQYGVGAGGSPAQGGNGLLYSLSPSLSVSLSGAASKTYDGSTAAALTSNATVTGLVNGDTAVVAGAYSSKNVGSNLTVTANAITVAHGGAPVYGYAGLTPSVSAAIGQINPAALTAAIVGDPTKTYNGTTTATLGPSNYQITGFASGEGATVNQPSTVAYASASAGSQSVNATFSATNFVATGGALFSNYTLPTSATGLGTILQAPLLISGVLATGKTYDRTTADTLNVSAAALYGVIGADAVSLVSSGVSGSFSTANVGHDLAVSASGFTLSGAQASNYALVQPGGLTASITAATLTVGGVSAVSKVYDGSTTATLNMSGAALSGVISGDTVTLGSTGVSGAFATADAGLGKAVTVSGFTLGGSSASNYSLTQTAGLTADITKKALAVAITATPSKVYDGSSTAVVDASGFALAGFVTGESGSVGQTSHISYATANAGLQAVTATLGVSDYLAGANTKLSNYILPSIASGAGAITAAPLTIQLVDNPTKTYDGTTAATLGASNFMLSGFLSGEGAAVTQTTGAYASKDAGVRNVSTTLSSSDFSANAGTLLSNYQLPTAAQGYGTINPAAVQGGIYAAIIGNPTKTYDGTTVATLTSSNFTLSGFASGEGATVTQTVGAYADKNAGVKPVTASLANSDFSADSGTNLANYTLPTSAYGSGTITPATLTATSTATATKVYNANTVATISPSSIAFAGLAGSESIGVSGALTAAYDASQAGTRTVSGDFATTNLTAGSGTLLSNYVLPSTFSAAGLITQAPVTILNVAALAKTYDTSTTASLSTGSASLFGVVGGDAVTLSASGVVASFASAGAASHVTVSASGFTIGGSDAANYQLFQPTGLFASIGKAQVAINGVTATDKAYDATNTAALSTASASLSGVYASDAGNVGLNASGASATFASVNVGANLAVTAGGFALSGAAASNYALSGLSGLHAAITPAALTALIVGDPTKIYDGSTSVTLTGSNYQLVGFVAGQGASLPQSATAHYVTADAGPRGVTSTLVSSDFLANAGTNLANYQLPVTGSGMGTITQAPLTAAIIGTPTKSYDSTTAATLGSADYGLRGFIGGQSATVMQTLGAYAAAGAGSQGVTATLSSGDYTAGSGTTLSNYLLPTTAAGTGVITKATLQVTGVSATSRAYDGTLADALNLSGAGVSGLFASDTVTLNSGASAAVFASRDAAAGVAVTASGFTIGGGQSANYTLAQPAGLSADITQAGLTLTRVQRVYDADTDLPTAQASYTLGGIVAADNGAVGLDVSGLSGAFSSKAVGSGVAVSINGLALTGARASNYSIAPSVSGAIGAITPATLSVTGVAVQNRTYDTTTVATLLNGGATLSGVLGSDGVSISTAPSTGVFASKNVGTRTVAATGYAISGADAGNYILTQPAGLSGVISAAPVTVATVSKTYDAATTVTRTATGTVNASTFTLSGVLGGESVAVATGVSGAYASKDAATGLNVSLSGLALTGSGASNYQISATQSGAIGTINKRALSVAFAGSPTKVYDTTTAATLTPSNFSVSGWASGEGGSITKTTGTYSSADVGSRTVSTTVAAGDYSANGNTLLSNYTLATPALSGTGSITRAPLTISGVAATGKVYDGTTADALSLGSATLQGVLGSDGAAVSLTTSGATGLFSTASVGAGKAVTASGFTLSGAKSGNYSLSQPTGLSADITQAMLQLASVTKVYDGTTAATGAGVSYTLAGIVGSDAVALNTAGLAGAYAAKDVGASLAVSLSGLSLTGAHAGDYSIAPSVSNAAVGVITPATLTLVGAEAVNKVYDGTSAAVISNAAASLSGVKGADAVTFSGPGSGAFASANAGLRAVTASGAYSLSGGDAQDYVLVQPTGFAATITTAPLSATITGAPTKTYDGAAAATLTSGSYTLAGFVAGQSATVTKTTGLYDAADAGARSVSASLAAGDFTAGSGTLLSNYTLPTSASGAGAINQRLVSGSVTGSPTKTYDGGAAATLAAGDYALSGFVAGQGATVTATAGTYASPDAGTRAVSVALTSGGYQGVGSTNLANYILPTTLSGSGVITPRTLSAAVTGDPTKTYDASTAAVLAAADYTLTGFVAGQGATVTRTSGLYDAADAGARTVSTTLAAGDFTGLGGTNLANYVLPTSASGAADILKRSLAVSIAGDPTKTYDGGAAAALTSADYALTGFVSGQSASVTRAVGAYDTAHAGTRTVSTTLGAGDFAAGAGTDLSNYALPTTASGAGAILQKSLTAAISGDPTRAYDGGTVASLGAGDFTLAGFITGQGATVTRTTGTYAASDAGARAVSTTLGSGDFAAGSATLLSDYALPTSATGVGHIAQATLSAAITGDPTKTYDGATGATLGASDYTLTGFVAGQGGVVTKTSASYATSDAGVRTVATLLSSGDIMANAGTTLSNYVLPTSASGAGDITQRSLSASISGAPIKTYDGSSAATLAASDFALTGFVAGQGASVTLTTGAYASSDAGVRAVSASLGAGDFAAQSGTNLANYALPTAAIGSGRIDPRALTAAITGDPTKAYDGATVATLTAADFTLGGFVTNQGATVTRTNGAYDGADAGVRVVSTTLGAGDFTGTGSTNLANYVLPTGATGAGAITPRLLTAAIVDTPTKTYDGGSSASLSGDNFALSGFVAGQGAAVTQSSGTYASADAGARTVTTTLGSADFTPTGGANLANYALPTAASGEGSILAKALTASLTGTPRRDYDGTTVATLTSGDFALSGFVAGQGASVTQTAGTYAAPSAGSHAVIALLAPGDFAAASGSNLSNYVLPTSATGVGIIDQARITAAITGTPTKVYDATTTAALAGSNFLLTGFVAGQGATVTQSAGRYAGADAGAQWVTAGLSSGDFSARAGTDLSNYLLPALATGSGSISQRALSVAITGAPTKSYDGTTAAALSSADYVLSGLVGGQSAAVTQAFGVYDAADAGSRRLTATLSAGDFVGAAGVNLANYALPTVAEGSGIISQRTLAVSLVGDPTRAANGTTTAALTSANFTVTGFASGEGAAISQAAGAYDAAGAGSHTVTATLTGADWSASSGTNLANYSLPALASGQGTITAAAVVAVAPPLPPAPATAPAPATSIVGAATLSQAIADNMALKSSAPTAGMPLSASLAAFAAETPRSYIPYPAPSALSTWMNNGFASLPSILELDDGAPAAGDAEHVTRSGPPLINSTEQILLQGGKAKAWTLKLPSTAPAPFTGAPTPPASPMGR